MKKSIFYLACILVAGTHFTNNATAQVTNENLGVGGAVYAMTNDPSENKIIVYDRDGNGQLHLREQLQHMGQAPGE